MPNLGELASYLVGLVTDAIGSSSMRLTAAPTVAILVVLLVKPAGLFGKTVTRRV